MRLLFCIAFLACITSARAQSPKAVTDYIEKYKKVAIEEMKLTGIPASVTLAQGIHESGCGCSALALNSNNHFGIKCHNEWTGVTYHHDDDQPQECFRVYKCPEESFKDHSDFLKTRPRYASLFKLEPTDYKGWARGLKAAGYATNPQYPQIIIKLIEDYKLNEYDKGVERPSVTATPLVADASKSVRSTPPPILVVAPSSLKIASQATTIATTPKTPVASQTSPVSETSKPKTTPTAAAATPKSTPAPTDIKVIVQSVITESLKDAEPLKATLDERLINGTKAIVYKTGISIASIARKYNLTTDQIYSYNDMMPNVKFKNGEYIYLEKKKAETTYYQYEIAPGETMRDVAQKFGVQMPELYRRNGITMDCEPIAGEIIVLRGIREVPIRFHMVDRGGSRKASTEIQPISDTKYHKVNDSDTLYSIARQYNIAVEDLMKMNGLKDPDIKIGQTLVISAL